MDRTELVGSRFLPRLVGGFLCAGCVPAVCRLNHRARA